MHDVHDKCHNLQGIVVLQRGASLEMVELVLAKIKKNKIERRQNI